MKKKILFLIVVILLAAGLKVDKVNASKQKENLPEDGYITVSERFYYDRIIGGGYERSSDLSRLLHLHLPP